MKIIVTLTPEQQAKIARSYKMRVEHGRITRLSIELDWTPLGLLLLRLAPGTVLKHGDLFIRDGGMVPTQNIGVPVADQMEEYYRPMNPKDD